MDVTAGMRSDVQTEPSSFPALAEPAEPWFQLIGISVGEADTWEATALCVPCGFGEQKVIKKVQKLRKEEIRLGRCCWEDLFTLLRKAFAAAVGSCLLSSEDQDESTACCGY